MIARQIQSCIAPCHWILPITMTDSLSEALSGSLDAPALDGGMIADYITGHAPCQTTLPHIKQPSAFHVTLLL
jgi:hypothetical protein